jgi:hypothetical protein
MIEEFTVKLIANLPDNITNVKEPLVIDLVMDGGAFNGSYLLGALHFLKEMEKRKYIKIGRISGCSVGSLAGFLYYIDGLHLMQKLYEILTDGFRERRNLEFIKDLKKHLGNHIPDDICQKINDKFFITYHNIKKGTKPVKCRYKNIDDVLNTIIKSSYIPFLIDGNLLYKNRYIDGIIPFIFKEKNRKILYLDLFGYDKIAGIINVKNEKSNYHRVISGLLDIHTFYIKQSSTQMCSYVNDWSILNRSTNYLKNIIEKLAVFLVYATILINKIVPTEIKKGIIYKGGSKILYEIFILIIDNLCL